MMRTVTSRAGRGIAAAALTVLAAAGAAAAVAGQGPSAGRTEVSADGCLGSLDVCGPVNGWQEDHPKDPR